MGNWGEEMNKEEQQKVDENRLVVVGSKKYDESFPVLKQINGRISRREKSAAYWNSTKLNLPEAATAAAEAVKPYYLRRKTRLIKSFHIDDNGQLVIEDDHDDQEQSLQQKSAPSSSSEEEKNVNGCHIIHMKSSDDDVDKLIAQETAAAPAPEEDQANQQHDKDVVFYEDAQIDSVGKTHEETAAEYEQIITPNEQVENDDHGDAEERDEQHMMKSDDDDVDKTPKQTDDHEQELVMINQPAEKAELDMALSSMHLKLLLQISPDGESTTPLQERESTTPTLAAAYDDDDDEKACGDGGEADCFYFGTIPVLIPRPKIISTQIPFAAVPDHDHHPQLVLINQEDRGEAAAFVVDQPSSQSESESNDLAGEREREAAAFVDEELASEQNSGTTSSDNQQQISSDHTQTQECLPTAAVIGVAETQVDQKEEAKEEISFGGIHYDHHFPNIDITQLKTTKRGRKLGGFPN